MSIWVCGEVLIDLIPDSAGKVQAIVGGGPANTAKALAKLGVGVEFIDGISSDDFGQSARSELEQAGVGLSLSYPSNKPTCTAKVSIAANGSATYEFAIDGTATFDFAHSWLPSAQQLKPSLLHIGTLVTAIEPAAGILHEWALGVADFAPIVFDPNIRSAVISDRDLYVAAVEKWVAISTVVKLSDEDALWLYPDISPVALAQRWISEGVALVVITQGDAGIIGVTSDETIEVSARKTAVVDTVGAGDTVGAVLVEAIVESGVLAISGEKLKSVLDRAAVAAAITCSRSGAQPPTAAEITTAMAG